MLSMSNIYFISVTSVCHYIINQKESLPTTAPQAFPTELLLAFFNVASKHENCLKISIAIHTLFPPLTEKCHCNSC